MEKKNLVFKMVPLKVFAFLLIASIAQPVIAQSHNINFFTATKGKVGFSYERAINSKTSAAIHFISYNVNYEKGLFNNKTKHTNNGFRIATEYRLYLSATERKMKGFYVAPNFSIGKHKVHYSHTTNSGLGLAIILATIDVVGDGDLDHTYSVQGPRTITGKANVTATGFGLKIGYQKQWGNFNLDMGVNFTSNSVLGQSDNFVLSNGEVKRFESDINNGSTSLYLGIGVAF